MRKGRKLIVSIIVMFLLFRKKGFGIFGIVMLGLEKELFGGLIWIIFS